MFPKHYMATLRKKIHPTIVKQLFMIWPNNLQMTNQLQKLYIQDYTNYTGNKIFYFKDKS